jgi:hypothetical protein
VSLGLKQNIAPLGDPKDTLIGIAAGYRVARYHYEPSLSVKNKWSQISEFYHFV